MPPTFRGNGRHAQADSVRRINEADTDWGGYSGSSGSGGVHAVWRFNKPTSFGRANHKYHEIGGIGDASALAGSRCTFVFSKERAGHLARRDRALYGKLQERKRLLIVGSTPHLESHPSLACPVILPASLSPFQPFQHQFPGASQLLFAFYRTCENVSSTFTSGVSGLARMHKLFHEENILLYRLLSCVCLSDQCLSSENTSTMGLLNANHSVNRLNCACLTS